MTLNQLVALGYAKKEMSVTGWHWMFAITDDGRAALAATEPPPAPQTTVMAPADYEQKLSEFLDALDEWGCEDNTERAEQIIEFQRTGYDLDAYLVEHPDRPKSEVN